MHKDVIAYHEGAYNPELGGINEIGDAFMDIFDEFNIDLVLTAHEHSYRNRGHIRGRKPGDSGPYYVMCGLAGDQRYPNLWRDPVFDKVLAPQPETDNYIVLTCSAEELRLECYLPSGEKIDETILRK